MSVDPYLWGPSAWKLLHDVSFYVSVSDDIMIVEKASAFFNTLRFVLPCTKCQYSYDVHLLHMTPPMIKTEFPRWIYDMHSRINNALKKQVDVPEFEGWASMYPSEMKKHTLREIWPFIQSVVEVIPEKESKTYRENIQTFFRYLWEFLYKMDAYYSDKGIIKDMLRMHENRTDVLHKMITYVGKKIHSKTVTTTCKDVCRN